ncbi:hypothetical protein H072_5646 [Dactylellina haptotyla CBS 200.50]|uniref:pectin lyase n=1 Tax=Dactylellina haptotyla (strain CBS 200.50) TaxID=1284197 RepID=S8BM32_DACHA|nr:hypothetical protein H072_5646 [Dactylellina haptotyla CBS 200.50]
MVAKALILAAMGYAALATPVLEDRATCAALYVCVYSNEWYSQCLAGTATPTTTKATTTTSKAGTTTSKSSVVNGSPMGFASGVIGGGNAAPVYPSTVAQLKSYLTSSSPQVIVISGPFNFAGTEGTSTFKAYNAYSCTPANGGQMLLNTLGGCGSQTLSDVIIDTAAYQGIAVKFDKTFVGINKATLNGKGLRLVGVSNIIIQNIAITNLNPKYVWGGDAIVLSDTSKVWIAHVTTSSLGRQHYSFGQAANKLITISNSFINGVTSYSATCDKHSYWGLELVGSGDQITFYKNYVYYKSGRSPALSGNTLFHAVNSVWSSNSGHAIEGGTTVGGLFEGCVFTSVPTVVVSGYAGQWFSSESAYVSQCASYLGRSCQTNIYSSSGSFSYHNTGFMSAFSGLSIVAAASASSIQNTVPTSAGNTL